MDKPIKVLIVEDNSEDAWLIGKLLERAGLKLETKIINDREAFKNRVSIETYDLILTDHSMYQFNSLDVLKIVKEKKIETPVIIISGTISDDIALQMIKQGAFDYVNKNDLRHLAMAIKKAVAKTA